MAIYVGLYIAFKSCCTNILSFMNSIGCQVSKQNSFFFLKSNVVVDVDDHVPLASSYTSIAHFKVAEINFDSVNSDISV